MSRVVLVTGGFGYLGGRIAEQIANLADTEVRLASRKTCPTPQWLPCAQTVVLDVLEPASLAAALAGVHTVVHLAALNENECLVDPVKALQVNTLGTLHLLRAAIEAGVERFVYFSTAHVYGAPLVGHITEQTLPRPLHPYAITHRAAEDFLLAAHDQKRITGLVVRLSNGFGAPMHADVDRWTLLVNDLCREVVQTRKLTLRSAGLQQRDFITLHDVGRAACHLLALPHSACDDGLFNLGGDASQTVWEMVQRIALRCRATLGFEPEIVRPQPGGYEKTVSLRYDMSKLKRTGFELNGDVDAEIDRTLRLCDAAWRAEIA
jgi:UDP-glucose 4-epimerase